MPIKDIETRDATLYIMNEDGIKTELGPVASVEKSIITLSNRAEVTLSATMDFCKALQFLCRRYECNNYRKLHGMPMARRKSVLEFNRKRYWSLMRKYFGSVKNGRKVFDSWTVLTEGKGVAYGSNKD